MLRANQVMERVYSEKKISLKTVRELSLKKSEKSTERNICSKSDLLFEILLVVK